MTDLLPLAAGAWGVLMGLAPLLQIRTILQRRSSADVSIGSMAVLLVGFALWLAYGLSIGDAALIATNVTALAVTATAIAVTLAFRRPRPPATTGPAPAPG
jgi:MtN3 and saliva related transmembrane protein